MRASEVLQMMLVDAWSRVLDARVVRRLKGAVDALMCSRQLVLMELARQYPGAIRVSAPLKALDRLLSNPRLQRARDALYAASLSRLWPVTQPWILVDWCTLKQDESLHLLRAAVPVGGRTLPVWDEVHGQDRLGNRDVHYGFLARLRRLVPVEKIPILITDAGFKTPWFRAAEELGFTCIGRLRGTVLLKPVGEEGWVEARAFNAHKSATVLDLGVCEIGKGPRKRMRVLVCYNPPKGRTHRTVKGNRARSSGSRAHARSAGEPWVLVVSTTLEHLSAREIIDHYRRRMQIEESFRDLKSSRFGTGLEQSLTRKAARMEVLLLIHALASIIATLVGLLARSRGADENLMPHQQAAKRQAARSRRSVLSVWRVGWELLKRDWLGELRRRSECGLGRYELLGLTAPASWR